MVPPADAGDIDLRQLNWQTLADGAQAAQLSVTSPDAAALRIQIASDNLPPGSELRFFDPNRPAMVYGPVSGSALPALTWALPGMRRRSRTIR